MYVQEFGSKINLISIVSTSHSYIDSIKYLRPEMKTVTGKALRTIVYHEIISNDHETITNNNRTLGLKTVINRSSPQSGGAIMPQNNQAAATL